MNDNIKFLEDDNSRLKNELSALEQRKDKLVKETDGRNMKRISNLEAEMEDLREKCAKDVVDAQLKSESDLKHMKLSYDESRQKLENRINEDKERHEKKINELAADHENRVKEDAAYNEENCENLYEDIRELEIQAQSSSQHFEQEVMMRQQHIETLEKQLTETKTTLSNFQKSSSTNLEQTIKNFNDERVTLSSKVESLKMD